MSRTRYGIERLAATLLVGMLSLTATARPPTTEWNPVARIVQPEDVPAYRRQYPLFKALYRQTKDIAHALGAG